MFCFLSKLFESDMGLICDRRICQSVKFWLNMLIWCDRPHNLANLRNFCQFFPRWKFWKYLNSLLCDPVLVRPRFHNEVSRYSEMACLWKRLSTCSRRLPKNRSEKSEMGRKRKWRASGPGTTGRTRKGSDKRCFQYQFRYHLPTFSNQICINLH